MKKILYLLSIIFIFSCEKENYSLNPIKEQEYQGAPSDNSNLKFAQISRIQKADADYIAYDVQSLYQIIASASNGDIIFLDENTDFDLSNMPTLEITSEIIIASSRNINSEEGAKIYSNNIDLNSYPKIKILSNNVRITGIRLIGPDNAIGSAPYSPQITAGIFCESYNDLKIDNCEISSWSYGGIYFRNSQGNRVVNNYIHHNRRTGLGYGVVLNEDSYALIDYNIFEYNRHDIAGTGHRTQSYEACYNIILNQGNGHSFDMHGEAESNKVPGSPYAGNTIYIHHNTFVSGTTYPAVKIRGLPFNQATIEYNKFRHSSSSSAIVQQNFYGNLTINNNTFNYSSNSIGNNPDVLIVNKGDELYKYTSFDGLLFATNEIKVGHGWNYTDYFEGSWTGNGTSDVIVRNNSGDIYLYPFNNGTFYGQGGPIEVGHGWSYTDYFVGDWTGNGTSDIIVRSNSGDMYLFPFNNGTFYGQGGPIKVGHGWNYTDYFVGDWTGNGTSDMIVRSNSGDMYLYPFNNGTFYGQGGPIKVGSGWNFNEYLVGNWTGNGTSDIIVRNNSGDMDLYPFNNGTFYGQGGPINVGTNWNYNHYIVGNWSDNGTSDLITITNQDSYLKIFDNNQFNESLMITRQISFDNSMIGDWE